MYELLEFLTPVNKNLASDTTPLRSDDTLVESADLANSNVGSVEPISLPLTSLENIENISDTEAAKGFVDKNGEKYYIIRHVVAYAPKKGYLIDWQGYSECDQSWNRPADMPRSRVIRDEMKQARIEYYKTISS